MGSGDKRFEWACFVVSSHDGGCSCVSPCG